MLIILKELPKYLSPSLQIKVKPINKITVREFDGLSVIPLIHYGVEGINLFESYDCVICMVAYNLKPSIIEDQLKRLGLGRDITVELQQQRRHLGREIATDPPLAIATAIFDYLERQKVLQTVCRARPYTSPTEVIFAGRQTFDGAAVFWDVRDLAHALGLDQTSQKIERCRRLTAEGHGQEKIAMELGCSPRTVSRYVRAIKKGCS